VTLKDGTLIVEYSSDGVNYERFFYGLKKMVVIISRTNHPFVISEPLIQIIVSMEGMNQKILLCI
jgi:hypothetical protein